MDPSQISAFATSIVAMLAPYFSKAGEAFASEIGQAASSQIGRLYQRIRAHGQQHPSTAEALADLQATPDDADVQAALRIQLRKQMAVDPVFAAGLKQEFDEIRQDPKAATFLTQVFGGEVGTIANIGNVDTVNLT